MQFIHDLKIQNTDPVLDIQDLLYQSKDYETQDTQQFDEIFRAPLPQASPDDFENSSNGFKRRRIEEESTNEFASSFIIKDGLITRDIHQDENEKIQNEKSDPVFGDNTKNTEENQIFGAGNAEIHGNENNFEDLVQKDDLIILQLPNNTKNQQSEIQTVLACFLDKDRYRKASEKERVNAARLLHQFGLVKPVNKRSNSGFDQQRRFHCDLCPAGMIRTFTNMEDLRRHFCQHLGHYPYKCFKCEKGFYRTDKRRKHIEEKHPDVKLPPKRHRAPNMKI